MDSILMSNNNDMNESNDTFLNDDSIRLDCSIMAFEPEDVETANELVHSYRYRQMWQKKVSPLSYKDDTSKPVDKASKAVEKSLVRPSRANMEDTFMADEEDDDCGDEEHATPMPSKKILWGDLISSMPSSSLDLPTSSSVHQYLEEHNKDSQSSVYKAMASKIMIHTVIYMGRKLHADGMGSVVVPQTSNTHFSLEPESPSSFVTRMGLSWSSTSTSLHDEPEEDAKDYLSNLSDSDFSLLKASLRKKGTLTGLCTQQIMYIAAATAAAASNKAPSHKRRGSSSSSSNNKWGQLPFCPSIVAATAPDSDDEQCRTTFSSVNARIKPKVPPWLTKAKSFSPFTEMFLAKPTTPGYPVSSLAPAELL
ncbi:expressed unknown protein [Seminavis robusta]|uniref:Uncharacterized protein n=1 Tax=Seminavis robusta TaxID=568900 RepID=A0A9N8DVC1_9STRA|nr:expressed unknown protein [Seminavis robusta]|eukprot:Sro310_g113970.1 n/a (366) ;mRNA; r:12603-13700